MNISEENCKYILVSKFWDIGRDNGGLVKTGAICAKFKVAVIYIGENVLKDDYSRLILFIVFYHNHSFDRVFSFILRRNKETTT